MPAELAYPLEQVLDVKKRRVEAAEKELQKRIDELEREKERLKEVEAARDKVKQHLIDKINQLRDTFDKGTNTDEIQMMRHYIKVVEENLQKEEEKVKKQEEAVENAEKAVELAREELNQRRREVDKLEEHKVQWKALTKKEQEAELAKEMDELGSILFTARQYRNKK